MFYRNVCIEGLGYRLPETVITSNWLEEQLAPLYHRLDILPGRIEDLTRIRERRWWDEGVAFSDAAAWAAQDALTRTGVQPGEVQVLVNTSVCRDYLEPATASIIHHKVGLPDTTPSFDLGNACLGFLNGMAVVADMIELGHIDTGLIVAGEGVRHAQEATLRRLLAPNADARMFYENMATLTLGSGSVAMILRHADRSRTGKRLLGGYTYSQTQFHDLCVAQPDWMRTDSTTLLHEGTRTTIAAFEGFSRKFGWSVESIDRVFTHQVSEKHRQYALRTIGFPDGIDYPTVTTLGNVAAAAAPLSMALALENGFLRDGDRAILVGVGSGISATIMGFQW